MVSNFAKVLQGVKATVSKPAFPTLLKKLYKEAFVKKPNSIMSDFNKSGLCPLDKGRVPKSKINPSLTLIPVNSSTPTQDENNVQFNFTDTPRSNTAAGNSINSIVNTPPVGPVTPRKALCRAILAAVQPTKSNLIASSLQNAKKRKKQVQQEHREVLTYKESLKQLRKEEEQKQRKQQKQKQKKMKKAGNNSNDIDVDENICYACNEEDPPSNDEDSENEIVEWVQCGKCKTWYHLNCVDDRHNPCQFYDDRKHYCCNLKLWLHALKTLCP